MLNKSTDKTEVQDALYNHLTCSSYHTKLSKEDCRELVRKAEVESWEEEWGVRGGGALPQPAPDSMCPLRLRHSFQASIVCFA